MFSKTFSLLMVLTFLCELTNCKSLGIMLLGYSHSGKSTLANALVRSNFFPVNHKVENDIITCKSKTIQWFGLDEAVNLIDAPGLYTNIAGQYPSELLFTIAENMKENDINLFVYCLSAASMRLPSTDLQLIKKLGEWFGEEIYNHFLVALTQGNTLNDSLRKSSYDKYFEELSTFPELKFLKTEDILIADIDNPEVFLEKIKPKLRIHTLYKPRVLFSGQELKNIVTGFQRKWVPIGILEGLKEIEKAFPKAGSKFDEIMRASYLPVVIIWWICFVSYLIVGKIVLAMEDVKESTRLSKIMKNLELLMKGEQPISSSEDRKFYKSIKGFQGLIRKLTKVISLLMICLLLHILFDKIVRPLLLL